MALGRGGSGGWKTISVSYAKNSEPLYSCSTYTLLRSLLAVYIRTFIPRPRSKILVSSGSAV